MNKLLICAALTLSDTIQGQQSMNYENSPLNYQNSELNYNNSSQNYNNSPLNYNNSSSLMSGHLIK